MGKNPEQLKVIAIAGSPRQEGNTDLLLKEAIAGVTSQGAKIKAIVLRDLSLSPCRHCDGCLETGKCVIEDDMQWIHKDLKEADRLILASPIFFMGVTAQTKTMIDRCQAFWVLKYVLKLPVATNNGTRKGIFISVGGRRIVNLFEPALATVKSFFRVLDITYAGSLLFPGIDEKRAITQHPTALKEAFLAGQSLVKDCYQKQNLPPIPESLPTLKSFAKMNRQKFLENFKE